MIIPIKTRVTSMILKVIVFISAFLGVFLSAYASKGTFMGGSTVFMFFTIQSNIAIALISLAGIFFIIRNKPVNHIWYVIKFVGTVSITLTGVVFTFVLAPTLGEYAWNIQNILTHVIVPAISIIDFFITGIYCNIAKRNVFFVIVPLLRMRSMQEQDMPLDGNLLRGSIIRIFFSTGAVLPARSVFPINFRLWGPCGGFLPY